MSQFDRPMDNPLNWSFKIGRLFRIDIRLHIIFILGAFLIIAQEYQAAKDAGGPIQHSKLLLYGLGSYAILFGIVLLHEFGHCFGARWTGGDADEILLWPLGGLAMVSPPHKPGAHLITTVAGPAVNVIICVIVAAVLILWTGKLTAVPWNPLHPLTPIDRSAITSSAQHWVVYVFGLSYLLFLFNLLPMFPLDGGRVLQSILWARVGYEQSMMTATMVGMIGAICLGVFGLFTGASWLLLMIAVFGYLECYRMRQMAKMGEMTTTNEFGYDFSRGYTSLDGGGAPERKPSFIQQWHQKRAARRAEKERIKAKEREQLVEQILAKVSQDGLRSLTSRERRILEEETARRKN